MFEFLPRDRSTLQRDHRCEHLQKEAFEFLITEPFTRYRAVYQVVTRVPTFNVKKLRLHLSVISSLNLVKAALIHRCFAASGSYNVFILVFNQMAHMTHDCCA